MTHQDELCLQSSCCVFTITDKHRPDVQHPLGYGLHFLFLNRSNGFSSWRSRCRQQVGPTGEESKLGETHGRLVVPSVRAKR